MFRINFKLTLASSSSITINYKCIEPPGSISHGVSLLSQLKFFTCSLIGLWYIFSTVGLFKFMEPEGSIPRSQGISNNPYTEPNQPNSVFIYLFKIQSNIVLLSTFRPS